VKVVSSTGGEEGTAGLSGYASTGGSFQTGATSTGGELIVPWHDLPTMPASKADCMTWSLPDEFWVAGGYVSETKELSDSIEVFTISTQTWHSNNLVLPMKVHDAVCIKDYDTDLVYFIGGFTVLDVTVEQASNKLYSFNRTTFTLLALMPTARAGHTAQIIGHVIYVCGGTQQYGSEPVFNTLDAYDIQMNMWNTLAPMHYPRFHLSSGVIGGKMYVFGGSNID